MSLKERRDVVALCRDAGAGVLFTVVRVAGSSYRRPGARMAVAADGRTAGTLSGGCLEAELLRRAAWTVRNGAVVERFSTRFDDTAEIPYGLGCGGEIDVLAEPLGTPEAAALLGAMEATLRGEERTVLTSLPRPGARFARAVAGPRRQILYCSSHVAAAEVATALALAEADPAPVEQDRMHCERLLPAERLVIFGAGEDARPLARMAVEMGWTVIVAGTRRQQLEQPRFPVEAQAIAAESAGAVPVLASDAVVLMTHSYEQDRVLLAELLPLRPRYLGLLGARHRSALLLAETSATAGLSLEEAVDRTHAPIGLELGGDGPEAIALAVTAELQKILAAAPASALTSRRMEFAQVTRLLQDDAFRFVPAERCALDVLEESGLQGVHAMVAK